MLDKKKRKIFSAAIALLLLLSVFSALSSSLVAQVEDEAVIAGGDAEENHDISELTNRLKEYIQENYPVDRPDVLDPELTKLLSGASFSGEGLTSNNELLTDPHTIDQHNVQAVHDMGITGENVIVSLMDTGFDMAHPDLIGTHAVFEYDDTVMEPEMEMYHGYPIAFDPVSMADFVFDGEISQDYTTWWGTTDNSWYVNTSYETTAYEEDGIIWANYTEKPEGLHVYEMPEGVEAGDLVRFGLHPDEKLHAGWGERPAVLLTQDEDGQWANVYADLWMDRSFAEEKRAYIDGDVPDSEVLTRDLNGDGIADISGGMVYFVAREYEGSPMPIPYTQHFRETMNTIINLFLGYPPGTIEALFDDDAWEVFIGPDFYDTPEPGDMIALMGDFNSFGAYGAHGTWTASAVAGQAVTGVPDEDMLTGEPSPFPPTPEGGDGLTRGLAPNAKIVPMGRFFDGMPEDNPLGMFPTTYSSIFFTAEGYTGDVTITSDSADIASSSFGRTIDENHGGFNFYERLFDYVGTQHTQNTLFINSQGNEGSGFGTVSAPSGAQGVLSVGATGNQLYRVDGWNMYDGGPNPWYGEVTGMTSTGPHAKGSHGPDIMTNGQFGYGADPLNQQIANIGGFQGNNSWTLWSGTSLSAPNAAGIAALVFEAYVDAHGEAPDAATLKNIIMQGANDINNTPNLQGPGDANALNSVLIAQGEGLYSEEFQWRPGTNPEWGAHVEHHVNILEPGDSHIDTLTLHNWHDEEIEFEINAYREEHVGSTQIELNSGPAGRVPFIVINETGVYELIYNETNENWDLGEEPIAVLDDPNAELFRFGTHTPKSQQNGAYSLAEFYHWTDVNDNGSFDGLEERTRIGYTLTNLDAIGFPHTSDYFTIHDAIERSEDGIIVQMNNVVGGDFDFTLNIEQYNHVQWNWIEVDGALPGTIDGEDFITYDMEAEVPNDAPKGIYSGKLMINDVTNDRIHPVPITITVGEYTNLEEPFFFGAGDGDPAHDQGIFRNDRLYGSWEGGLTGDWRFYTFHLEEDILDRDITLELNFDNEMSDMTAFLLGGAEHDLLELGAPFDVDPFSIMNAGRYGLNTLETIHETDIDRGDYVAFVREEGLEQGTYMIALQSHQISGYEPSQIFSGQLTASYIRTPRDEARVVDRGAINFPGELLAMPDGAAEVNASFRYRQVGEDDWNESEGQTLTETGEFHETVTGLEDGTYEWKPVIEWNPEQTGVIGTPVVLQDLSEWLMTSPAEGEFVRGDPLTIQARMVDFEDELVDASISLGDWFPYDNVEIENNHAWWNVPVALSEGTHDYEFYVEDEYGNDHTEHVTFEVLNHEPYLEITSDYGYMTYDDEFIIEGLVDEDSYAYVNGVEVYDPQVEWQAVFHDDLTEGDLGYTTRENPEGVNEWGIRDHGSYVGDLSWDFGDGNYDADPTGALSELISPEIDLHGSRDARLTFWHWRDFEDAADLWDGGNLKISTDGGDSWDLLIPEEGYDGTVIGGYNNPLAGQQAWGHSADWEIATFDLGDYIDETIHLNWQAGADDWDTGHQGWRIDNILIEGLLPIEEGPTGSYTILGDSTADFTYETTLEEGLNVFEILAVNPAGITSEQEIYVTYLPDYQDIPLIWESIDDLWDALDETLTEAEIHALLEDYVTHGELAEILEDYLTEAEIHALLEDYVNETHLAEVLEDYLTEAEIDALLEDYLTEAEIDALLDDYLTEEEIDTLLEAYLTEAEVHTLLEDYLTEAEIRALLDDLLSDYLKEAEIDALLEDYVTEGDLSTTLESYLTEEQIDSLISNMLDDYVTDTSLATILEDYLEEDEINEVMGQLESDMMAEIETMLQNYAVQEEVDEDIESASNMALVGIILGILALIIAIFAVAKKAKGSETESFEEESFEEEDDLYEDDDIF